MRVTVGEFQEPACLGPRHFVYKISTLCEFKGTVILHPLHLSALQDRCCLNSDPLRVSEGSCLLCQIDFFHSDTWRGLCQHLPHIWWWKKATEYCNSFHTGFNGVLLWMFWPLYDMVCRHMTVTAFQTDLKRFMATLLCDMWHLISESLTNNERLFSLSV